MKKILLFIAVLFGLSSVPSLAQGPNMSKYITLTVQSGKAIKLNFKAAQAGTPVSIVSGTNTENITVGTDWYNANYSSTYTVQSDGTEMTIYGDIVAFRCNNNNMNITAVDPSRNNDLREINCSQNAITALNVSSNTQLRRLCVYGNKFTTLELDKLYCSLPSAYTSGHGIIYPMNVSTGSEKNQVLVANGSNTLVKSWEIRYWNNGNANQELIPSSGTYVCGSPEPDTTKYITLNVSSSRIINLNFKANNPNTTLKIKTGTNIQEITVGKDWNPSAFNISSLGADIKIYGDIVAVDCSNNGNNLTGVISTNLTQLEELNCAGNNITSIDLTANTNLKSLICSNNQINALYLSPLINLETLDCNSNKIAELNLSNKPQLKEVNIGNNKVAELAFNESTLLRTLNCNDNKISILNFTNQAKLEELYCSNNTITALDLSEKAFLRTVDCSKNELSTLNVNNTPKLTFLSFFNNKLNTFEIDKVFCALPVVDGTPGRVYPINYQQAVNDPNVRIEVYVLFTNGDNAKNKNWEVKNWNNGINLPNNKPHDVFTNGTYICGSTPADLTNFITLQAEKTIIENNDVKLLKFNFKAPNENTNVRIVNGDNVQEFTVGKDYADEPFKMISLNEEVKIYGDIEVFDCSHNLANINGLDASNHSQLKEIHCNNNSIAVINVNGLDNLNTLHCENNQIAELNLSDNAMLKKLDCSNNALLALNLDNNTQISFVACNNNQIANLSVINNTQLAHLECYNNQLPALNLEGNVNLRRLYCHNNLFNTEAVNKIYCSLPKVTGTPGLCYMLNTLVDPNHETTVAATAQNARYKNWEVKYYNNNQAPQNDIASAGNYDCGIEIPTPNPDGGYMTLTVKDGAAIKLNFKAIADNTPVRIVSGNTVKDITVNSKWYSDANPSDFTVTADGNTMTIYGKIDCFDCSQNENNIIKVDGGNNTHLKDLYCYNNTLMSELNLSDNTQLRELRCESSNLASLDLTKNYELKNLHCFSNNIAELDLSNNTELRELFCYANKLTKLVLNNNKKLEKLNTKENYLIKLDLSKNQALVLVDCRSNSIDTLIIENTPLLERLYCDRNNLLELDLSKNLKLFELNCANNQITTLDVSNNIDLVKLYCENNKITEFNFAKNTKLTEIALFGNPLNTDATNEIYCSLPKRIDGTFGTCYPLFAETDITHDLIVAATSKNARDKKWNVKYKYTGADIPNNGTYDCNAVLDSNKLITLVVSKDTTINFNLKAENSNTRVIIVNGNQILKTMTSPEWRQNQYSLISNHDTIKIYGNISGLKCNDNTSNVTAIDLSKNSEVRYLHIANNNIKTLDLSNQSKLTELNCFNNQITTLDISNKHLLKYANCQNNNLVVLMANNNNALTSLQCQNNMLPYLDIKQNINLEKLTCYNNSFSTEAMNQIYCALPTRPVNENGICYALNDKSDANHAKVVAATSNNARNKNWVVNYSDTANVLEPEFEIIPNNGNYDCGETHPDLSKYITLDVKKGEIITVDFLANKKEAIVQIVSGNKVQNVTAVTDWNTATYSVSAEASTIRFYGDIIGFNCSNNKAKITGINVSNNTQLRELNCFNNKISTIDVTKNAKLEVLAVGSNLINSLDITENLELQRLHIDGNVLVTIDLSKNTNLTTLTANDNKIVALDLSKNTNLALLEVHSNDITALDLSKNTKLNSIICYDNPFTTRAVNELYCSLPTVKGKAGLCFPLNTKDDKNHAIVSEATSQNAVNKNWEVKYYNNGSLPYNDIVSNGNFECGSEVQEPNMNRYITLKVATEQNIKLDFKASEDDTPIRIVNGSNIVDITVGSSWYNADYSLVAKDAQITVYGNIVGFNCSQNEANLTALEVKNNPQLSELICNNNTVDTLDLSLNTALKSLNCANNKLRYIDVRNNAKLELISCYNNPFTTFAVNVLYCSLQAVNGNDAVCYSLNSTDDANYNEVVAATSNNARDKNWKVRFKANDENVPSNGNFDCNSGVDATELSGFSVYPNPAYGKVQVQLSEDVNETLILVDLTGRAVLTADMVAGKANIDVSNLTAGTYLIRVGNRVQKLTVK